MVCDGGCLAASDVESTRVSEFYCSPGAFSEVTNTSNSTSLLALAPAAVPEHLAGECQQALDVRGNAREVPVFDRVADELVLEGLCHRVSPNSLDLGWDQLWYCGVSVWELHWSCGVIHVWGVRGGSAEKVLFRVLHVRIGGGRDADGQRLHVWGERVYACVRGGDGVWDESSGSGEGRAG